MLKPRSVFSLAATVALLTVVAPGQPFSRATEIASTATFELPAEVPTGTTVRVSSGSDAMNIISDALKTGFENEFNGTDVTVETVGADQAIEAVLNGNADLAAISRPLSDAEVSQGLASETIQRVKIAMIVGADNPFDGSLTSEQFAKIFRGDITNWSEVGGPNVAIRLVDRPDTSDTRLSLSPYPVFKTAQFATGTTATQANADSTADIVKELGTDGISYALVDEVDSMAGVRVLAMHKTLPTDARYPFSQPFSFVYKDAPSVGGAAFLGYAAGNPGQTALKGINPFSGLVNAAGDTVTGAVDAASNVADAAGDAVTGAADAAGDAVTGAADAAGNVVEGATDAASGVTGAVSNAVTGAAGAAGDAVQGATDAAGDAVTGAADAAGNAASATGEVVQEAVTGDNAAVDTRNPSSQTRLNLWWLMLVPAACLGLVAWGERRRRQDEHRRGTPLATDGTYAKGVKAQSARVKGPNFQGPNVVDGIGKAGAIAGGTAAAAGGAAWSATRKTGNTAKDGLNNVAKRGLGTVKGGLNNIGDAAQDGLGNAGNAVQGGVGAMGAGLKGGMDKAGNAAKGGLGAINGGLHNVGDAAKGGLNKADNAAKDGLGTVKGGLDNAGNAVQGGVGAMGAGLKGGMDKAGNSLRDGADAATDGISGLANQTGNTLTEGANTAKAAPKSLWERVRKGVNNAADQANDVANQTKQQAGNLKDSAETLGQQGMDKASDIADKLTDN